jgi:group I intron endonuclease
MIQENLNKVCGVYSILHRDSGKRYVGSSAKIGQRFTSHINDGRKQSRSCIHRAIREYGADAFDFTLIEACDKDVLRVREKHWIEHFNSCSVDHGFNSHPDPTNLHDCIGHKQSDTTIARRVEKLRGKKRSPEICAKMAAATRAARKPMSEETRAKLKARIKPKHTPESIEKILATKRERYGVSMISPESRAKISAATLGHPVTEETRQKLREKLTGIKHPPRSMESRLKASQRMKGVKWSDDVRRKIACKKKATRLYRNADYIQFMWLLPFPLQLTYTRPPDAKYSSDSRARAVASCKKTMAIRYPEGIRMSEETKKKIGDGNRGKTVSMETRIKIGNANRGRKFRVYQNQLVDSAL